METDLKGLTHELFVGEVAKYQLVPPDLPGSANISHRNDVWPIDSYGILSDGFYGREVLDYKTVPTIGEGSYFARLSSIFLM